MKIIRMDSAATSVILREELELLKQRIIANMRAQNAVATGKTIQSMHVEADADGGTLWGRKFFSTLETGRGATRTRTPSNPTLYECILEWVRAKGLGTGNERETQSIAYAITKTIHRSGTQLYRRGGRDTIYTNEIPKTIEAVRNRLFFLLQESASTDLKNITIE